MSRFSGKSTKAPISEVAKNSSEGKGGFYVYPGTYRAIISDVSEVKKYDNEQRQNSFGIPYIEVTFKITKTPEGFPQEFVGREIKFTRIPLKRLWNSKKVNFMFDGFWKAVGAYDEEEQSFTLPAKDEFEDLVDPEFEVVLTVEDNEYNGRVTPQVRRVSENKGQALRPGAAPKGGDNKPRPAVKSVATEDFSVTSKDVDLIEEEWDL